MFLAGLARLDYVEGATPLIFTTFISRNLPGTHVV